MNCYLILTVVRLLEQLATERGGLIPTYRLRQEGMTPRAIAGLCHAGRLERVRQGWYVLPGWPLAALEAVRVGGQLTCDKALGLHDIWVVRDSRLHVAVNRDATQLRSRKDPRRRHEVDDAGVCIHWRRVSAATTSVVATVPDALSDYAKCAPREHLIVAVDSALHRARVETGHPIAARFMRMGIDGTCESGTETIFWLRMRRHRLSISRQVRFRGLGRVDFLIGERLIVEVDGETFHNTESQFAKDRHRDAYLSTIGYRVLRFSFHQVMHEWNLVEAAVLAAIARGDHLRG